MEFVSGIIMSWWLTSTRRCTLVLLLIIAHCCGVARNSPAATSGSNSALHSFALSCNVSSDIKAPPVSHKCRLVLLVNDRDLKQFNFTCESSSYLRIRLGSRLLNLALSRGPNVTLANVNISDTPREAAHLPPPAQPPTSPSPFSPSDCGAVPLQTPASSQHDMLGQQAPKDYDDWGIDILDVNHLLLVDSILSGVPLSLKGPLLNCVNCSHLTAQNLTLENLASPVPSPPPPPPPPPKDYTTTLVPSSPPEDYTTPHVPSSPQVPSSLPEDCTTSHVTDLWYGATRFSGLSTATLERVQCMGVRGASIWACVDLQMRATGGNVIIRDCEFSNNIVSSPVTLRQPTDGDGSINLPYYGAVLIRGVKGVERANSTVEVISTKFSGNRGVFGAGLAVVEMCPVRLLVASSTFTDNSVSNDGGGLYIFEPQVPGSVLSPVDFMTCSSDLSFNNAEGRGGAAALHGKNLVIRSVVIRGSEMMYNSAMGNAGAVYALSAEEVELFAVQGSNVSHNGAGGDGGAVYLGTDFEGFTNISLAAGSCLQNNSAFNGGAMYVDNSDKLGAFVIDGDSTFSDNVATGEGGAIYISSTDIDDFILTGGSSIIGNQARQGGGVQLRVKSVIERLQILQSASLCRNYASGNLGDSGGGVFVSSGELSSLTIFEGFISDNAADGYGGGISLNLTSGGYTLITILRSNALRNTAATGGFLHIQHSTKDAGKPRLSLNVSGSTIAYNSAKSPTGNGGDGGAFYFFSGIADITVELLYGSSLSENTALGSGGAIYSYSGGSYWFTSSDSSIMINNAAGYLGGGMCAYVTSNGTGNITISGASMVVGNRATDSGGGLYTQVSEGNLHVTVLGRSRVDHNIAGKNGGAMLLRAIGTMASITWDQRSSLCDNGAGGDGGGVHATALMTSVLVDGGSVWSYNRAEFQGGALHVDTSSADDAISMPDIVASSITFNGSVNVSANTARSGAGIFIKGFANITLAGNSTFDKNVASLDGGLIATTRLPPTLNVSSCSITNNNASLGSGGVFSLVAVELPSDSDYCGACIFNKAESVVNLSMTRLTGNWAQMNGGVIYILVGEFCCEAGVSLSINGIDLESNHADGSGGAVALINEGRRVSINTRIRDSRLSKNSAGTEVGSFTQSTNFGGAVFIWCSAQGVGGALCILNITNSVFELNRCIGGSGGAIMLLHCILYLTNASFQHNQAVLSGGAVASMHVPRRTSSFRLVSAGLADIYLETGLQQSSSVRRRALLQPRIHRDVLHINSQEHQPELEAPLSKFRYPRHNQQLHGAWFGHTQQLVPHRSMLPHSGWETVVKDCSFVNNTSQLEHGGAVYIDASSTGRAWIKNCTLKNNMALQQHGGALFLAAEGPALAAQEPQTNVAVQDSYFDQNIAASASAGAMYLLLGREATGEISGNIFKSNIASTSGGACVLDIRSDASLLMQNVSAVSNQAARGSGGAMQLQAQSSGNATITDCTFSDNYAGGTGGAMLMDGSCGSILQLTSSRMKRNRAKMSGGAVYVIYHGSQQAQAVDSEVFGPAPVPAEVRSGLCNDLQYASLSFLQLADNQAGSFGGAICAAPYSATELSDMDMHGNMAGVAGGSLAGLNCSALKVFSSNLTTNQARVAGGGLYTDGCRRLQVEWVRVGSNTAGAAGGGLAIAGLPASLPGREPLSIPLGSYTNTDPDFTAALLNRVQVYDNVVLNNLAPGHCAEGVDGMSGCGGSRWRLSMYHQGGGVFVTERVVLVLNQCDLARGNSAVFGAALASTQHCYPTGSVSLPKPESASIDTVWDALQRLGQARCWVLQLTDTLLPERYINESEASPVLLKQAVPLWMEDVMASSLYPNCDQIRNLVREHDYDVWIRVVQTLSDSIDRAINASTVSSAGKAGPQVPTLDNRNRPSIHRSRLFGRLPSCMEDPAKNISWLREAIASGRSYIGLPPTHMALDWTGPTVGATSRPILYAGSFFDVGVQLMDAFQQRLTLDAMSSTVTLAIKPAPPRGAQGHSIAPPLQDDNIANLDPGLNKSVVVPVADGVAKWTRVIARGWPNDYYLTFTLTSVSASNFTVEPLQVPVSLLPCTVGQTLDLDTADKYSEPSWTGCKSCGTNQYGLWKDSRKKLWQLEQVDYRTFMNDTNHLLVKEDAACQPCPANAECSGGAVIAPKPGYWHSALNSTRIHVCPNPEACGSGSTPSRVLIPQATGGFSNTAEHSRTQLLVACQEAWYASGQPNDLILGTDGAAPGANSSSAARLPLPPSDSSGTPMCQLESASDEEAVSYMQLQCEPGYTGNLCAACIPGYFMDSDFNCKRCPSVAHTVGLGLVSFFSSVGLVLFTAMTNFTEGFGEKADKALTEQKRHHNVELGDVVKVIVLHIQYLVIVTRLSVDYPDIIREVQAVFSTLTGAENYLVYSPSCLKTDLDSAGQARISYLAGILTPCVVVLISITLWTIRYNFPNREAVGCTAKALVRAVHGNLIGMAKNVGCWLGRPLCSAWIEPQPVLASASEASLVNSLTRPTADQSDGFKDVNGISLSNMMQTQSVTKNIVDITADSTQAATVATVDTDGTGLAHSVVPRPASASVANVVDFLEMDLGTGASAPEPVRVSTVRGDGMIALKLSKVCELSAMREEDASEVDLLPEGASTIRYMPGDVLSRYSITTSAGDAPTPGLSLSHRYASFHRMDTRHRKTPKEALAEITRTGVEKISSLVVNTQRSNNATLNNVDKALSLLEQLGVVVMAAVFILYPSWAQAALSTFACYKIDDKEGAFPETQQAAWAYGYWVRNMQAQCFRGDHLRVYVPIGVVSVVIFCLAPPLASFWFVWRVRSRLDDTHVRKVYGFLYKRYKPSFIWWETVLQLETLVLVSVEVLGRGLQVAYQALLLLAVFIIIAAINVSIAPLLSRLLVIMEFMSLSTLSLTITLSLYFTVEGSLADGAENTLAITIIALNVCLMVFFLYVAGLHYWPAAFQKVVPKAQATLQSISIAVANSNRRDPNRSEDRRLSVYDWLRSLGNFKNPLKRAQQGSEAATAVPPTRIPTGNSDDLGAMQHMHFRSVACEANMVDTTKAEGFPIYNDDYTSCGSGEPPPPVCRWHAVTPSSQVSVQLYRESDCM